MGLERPNFAGRFERPVEEGEIYLTRTHPVVEGLASYVLDVTIFGNTLHLLVDAAVDDATLERELTAASGSPVHVRPIEPSLEDVFVRLTRIQTDGDVKARPAP